MSFRAINFTEHSSCSSKEGHSAATSPFMLAVNIQKHTVELGLLCQLLAGPLKTAHVSAHPKERISTVLLYVPAISRSKNSEPGVHFMFHCLSIFLSRVISLKVRSP